VEAGTAIGDLAFCEDQDQVINLNAQLTGADAGGVWTGPSGNISGGSVNTTSLAPGSYTYTYTVDGLPPCPDDQASFTLTLHPVPVADAGADQKLDCDITQVTLGGSGTTPGVNYSWTGGNVSDAKIAQPTTTEPGTYTLVASNTFGCSDSDVAVITQTITNPIPHVTINDISCFGKTDGFIVIDSVTGGVPPYLYSFNGSAFSTQKSFTNLGEGTFSITILDAAGCESTLSSFIVNEPQEVTVDIKGNFEGNDPVVQLGESVVLVLVTNPPFNNLDSVHWFPPDLVPCDTCQSNEVTPVTQTTFSVVVEKDGCKGEDDITIFVKKSHPVYVPNAFSPNDDLINDVLEIFPGPTVAKVKSFLVFNRWGETVFQYYNFVPGDPAQGWDGTHRGEKLNPGVFTWFAEIEFIDGLVEVLEGDVILMR
jgi:gliding motility-associated-like protein